MPDFTARDLRNLFGVLNILERDEVCDALDRRMSEDEWFKFPSNFPRMFQKANDAQQDAIAEVINKRLSKLTEIAVKIGDR